jgi:hypothetical protein
MERDTIHENLKGEKMSTKHKEFSVEMPESDVVFSFVINRPLVTCEVSRIGANYKLMSWGVSYCRPMDSWNAEVGVRLAAISAVKKLTPEGVSQKSTIKYVIEQLEPALTALHDEAEYERRKELANIRAYLREECGDCCDVNKCANEVLRS